MRERMGCKNERLLEQPVWASPQALENQLALEPSPPVLLPLPAETRQPATMNELLPQAFANVLLRGPESTPETTRAHGVHRTAIRASPSLHRNRSLKPAKVPVHITVAPQPIPSTPNTSTQSRPSKYLSESRNFTYTGRYIQYQGSHPGNGIGMTGAGKHRGHPFFIGSYNVRPLSNSLGHREKRAVELSRLIWRVTTLKKK